VLHSRYLPTPLPLRRGLGNGGWHIDVSLRFEGKFSTSHDPLDRDEKMQEEVRNAAQTLLEAVQAGRAASSALGKT
jgi:hypothetical protein